jgi:hypothetical protein
MTVQQANAASGGNVGKRLLLPVPGLDVVNTWQVGPVLLHPADDALELICATQQEHQGPDHPAFQKWLWDRISALSGSAVAEVSVTDANDAEAGADARELVASALAIMRAVQHMRNFMNEMDRQTFGLPGDVPSAVTDYVVIGDELTAGATRSGALAGWTFSDAEHQAWTTDPAFRFLNCALSCPEPDRTILQGRALLAINLLSQGWLSYKPDVELLNSAMALEVLLGEPDDKDKKFRIARRVSYFSCGWPRQLYPGTGRPACRLMSLPLGDRSRDRGVPGPELQRALADMKAGRAVRCSRFFQVCRIYEARNEIVHRGRLPVGGNRPSTWFIAALLLSPVLTWFASHPDSDLSELDADIAALPTPPAQPPR